MANKLAIIGLPNAIGQSGVVITAGTTAAAGMPLTNLATDEPSDLCRLETVDPAKTWWNAALGYPIGADGYNWPIRGIGLVNHNLERRSEYRFRVFSRGQASAIEALAPTGISISSGWSGAATDIDEDPFSPDGVAGVISTTNGYVLLDFATPSQWVTGTKRHVLIVRAKASSANGCTFAAYVAESGTNRLTLGTAQQLGTSYRNYVFTFDPVLVTLPAGFQIRIVGTDEVGVLGKTMSIDAVRWQADVTTYTPVGDTGWLSAPVATEDATFGSTYSDELGNEPTLAIGSLFSSDKLGGVVEVMVRNLAVEPNMSYSAIAGSSGYTQAGVLVAGPAMQPTYAPLLGDVLGVRDASSSAYTLGGATYGSARRRRRVAPVRLAALTMAEGWGLFERIDWMLGTRGAVLVMLFPEATDQGLRLGTFWATVDEPGTLASSSARSKFTKTYTFIEKL